MEHHARNVQENEPEAKYDWKRSTAETVCLLSNRKSKPDTYVKLSLDMEDYYRIKDAEGETKIE